MENTFGITATGDVYRREPHTWVLLGTLPGVLNDPSLIGRTVRNWWKSLVESDEAMPLLILRNPKLRGPRIPSSEAMVTADSKLGWQSPGNNTSAGNWPPRAEQIKPLPLYPICARAWELGLKIAPRYGQENQ